MLEKLTDLASIKAKGFLKQRQKDLYSLRLKIVAGGLDSQRLQAVADIATRFGRGKVHLTARQSMEIPFIPRKHLEETLAAVAAAGLRTARCGARVRTVTGCQGSAVCQQGLIDSGKLARLLDKHFGDYTVPHKFKLGVTGCRNNCLKAEENDIGVKGVVAVEWKKQDCNFCGLCQKACPAKAIEVGGKKLAFTRQACVACGLCVKACPRQAWVGKNGFQLYFGGLFGKDVRIGRPLLPIVFSPEELLPLVEAALAYFAKQGKAGERFFFTLERTGWGEFQKYLEKRFASKKPATVK
jgi:dissimilatory sulfite reductase (desulfoviridin) alpha/beta subunit